MTMEKGFAVWFVFCLLVGLAVLAFGGWAVYELVSWVTSQ